MLGPVLFLEDDVLVLDPGLFVVGFFWGVLEKREREEKKKKKSEKEEKKKLENKNPKRKKNSKKKKRKTHPQGQVELGGPHVPGGPRHGNAGDRQEGPAKGDLRPADAEHLAAGRDVFFVFLKRERERERG